MSVLTTACRPHLPSSPLHAHRRQHCQRAGGVSRGAGGRAGPRRRRPPRAFLHQRAYGGPQCGAAAPGVAAHRAALVSAGKGAPCTRALCAGARGFSSCVGRPTAGAVCRAKLGRSGRGAPSAAAAPRRAVAANPRLLCAPRPLAALVREPAIVLADFDPQVGRLGVVVVEGWAALRSPPSPASARWCQLACC